MTIQEFNFTNDQLNGSFELVFTHNKNTQNIVLFWFDENLVERTQTDTFQVLSDTSFKIMTGGAVTGTQTVRMVFNDSQVTGGKRLFVDYNTNPNFSDPGFDTSIYKVAYGNAISTYDETLENFIDKCRAEAPVDALIKTNNLSDVDNKSAARANLSIETITDNDKKFYNYTDGFAGYTFATISPATLALSRSRYTGVFDTQNLPKQGKLDLGVILNTSSNNFTVGNWIDILTLPSYYETKESYQFTITSSSLQLATVRLLGQNFYNEQTGAMAVTPSNAVRKLQIYFIGQVTGSYYININASLNRTY